MELYHPGVSSYPFHDLSPQPGKAGREVYRYLVRHHLRIAQLKVGKIVGRDTDHLDSPEVTRATVETIAENTIDGIVSPLFFFAIGGLPLAVVYRAANTLDSMIGYKNDKYIYFGRVAARVDDVLNYIPARICALRSLRLLPAWAMMPKGPGASCAAMPPSIPARTAAMPKRP